jgi:hypothetical protein
VHEPSSGPLGLRCTMREAKTSPNADKLDMLHAQEAPGIVDDRRCGCRQFR